MVAVSIDSASKLEEMRRELGLSFLNLIDRDSLTIRRYGVLNEEEGHIPHPAALVIDKAGVIRYKRVDVDYTKRPASAELIGRLVGLRAAAPGESR